MRNRIIHLSLIALLLTDCSLPFDFSSSPKSYYKLSVDAFEQTFKTRSERIGVRDIASDGFVDSHKVLFTTSAQIVKAITEKFA